MQAKLSIIIPVLNETSKIESCLDQLQLLRQQGHEVIVVDGGSNDNTVSLAIPLSDKVIQSKKSRAIQMNTGAAVATGQIFLFLHADTTPPSGIAGLFSHIKNSDNKWGRFDVKLSGHAFLFRIIEHCMNLRSRLTGIATGDQLIFIGRKLFDEINGFPELALMEDIAISKLLLKRTKPICFKERVITSSRRWEEKGIIRTILKMWLLRLLYFFHIDTNKLAKIY
jgi:rSAM/selenodomain-associated transferase 2